MPWMQFASGQSRSPKVPMPKERPEEAPQLPPVGVSQSSPWSPRVSDFGSTPGDNLVERRWAPLSISGQEPPWWLRVDAPVAPEALPKLDLSNLQRHGIDPDDLVRRMVRSENASQDPRLRNPASSATGLTQMLGSTWLDLMRTYQPDLYDWWKSSPKRLLDLRMDPALSRQMGAAYADQNAAGLANANLPVAENTLYLAHHFGLTGAKNILGATPDTLAVDVLSHRAVQDNPNVVTPSMTVRELRQWAADRMKYGPGRR